MHWPLALRRRYEWSIGVSVIVTPCGAQIHFLLPPSSQQLQDSGWPLLLRKHKKVSEKPTVATAAIVLKPEVTDILFHFPPLILDLSQPQLAPMLV